MKRLLLLLIINLCWLACFGQNFKILYLSSDSITIGNKQLRTGGVFGVNDDIRWDVNDDRQNMTIQNLTTYVQKMVDRESLKGYASIAEYEQHVNDPKSFLTTMLNSFKSFIDYYINTDNHTSYRNWEKTEAMNCMEELLSQTYFLDERICIPCCIKLANNEMLLIRWKVNGTECSMPLLPEDDCICISRQMLVSSIPYVADKTIKCDIIYVKEHQKSVLSDTFEIILL